MFEDCCKANGAPFKNEGRFNPHLTIAKITQLEDWLELIEGTLCTNFFVVLIFYMFNLLLQNLTLPDKNNTKLGTACINCITYT